MGMGGTAGGALGGLGGLGALGGLGGLPSAFPGIHGGATAANTNTNTNTNTGSSLPPEELYASQLRQLQDMGFTNQEQNIAVLRQVGGNVNAAVDRLLSGL